MKARDFMFKWAWLLALIGSFIILIVPFLEWIKHDTFYRVWYSTGLDLMTMKYRALQPFLVFVAGAFGIVGAFAMGKRTNVIGRYIVLAAAVLAVSSFLYWIFSDLYLIYAGGGRTIKMMAPWFLLVGAGCFCFSAAGKSLFWQSSSPRQTRILRSGYKSIQPVSFTISASPWFKNAVMWIISRWPKMPL